MPDAAKVVLAIKDMKTEEGSVVGEERFIAAADAGTSYVGLTTGPTGTSGLTGPQGATGAAGAIGPTGPQGA